MKGVAIHGDDVVTDAAKEGFGLCISPRSAQRGEQRQQMFVARVCTLARGLLPVVQQSGHIALHHVGVDPVGKFLHISGCGAALHAHSHEVAQVVRHIARGHDQDVLFGQRCQRLAHTQGVGRAQMALDRQRDDRDIGIREHLAQGCPGTVVQTALCVLQGRQACGLQGGHHLRGSFGAAGGGVLHLVQAGVKTTEVVDGFGSGGKAHGGRSGLPVGADHHDGAGCAQRGHQFAHGRTRSAGAQGKHGGAVGHKQDRAWGGHGGGQ